MNQNIINAANLAIVAAKSYEGATSPNPPVGAVGITKNGEILAVAAHEKYGEAHAEVNLIQKLYNLNKLQLLHTLFVTLEPCNHYGNTPPCVKSILETSVKNVIIGCLDPNPQINGKGLEELKEKIKVFRISDYDSQLENECQKLIRPYTYWIKNRKPWVILKQAFNLSGNMIPNKNQKTFTSMESLIFAHALRKKADAIITGSGTALMDNPKFTVRYVPDHLGKQRCLILLDHRKRTTEPWKREIIQSGFRLIENLDFTEALHFLGQEGAHIALVEAGPKLCNYVLNQNLWNEKVGIFQSSNNIPDKIIKTINFLN